MVRHHVKKDKKSNFLSSENMRHAKEQLQKSMRDLDRFAGSSEEDNNSGDSEDEHYKENSNYQAPEKSADDEAEEEYDDKSSDEDEYGAAFPFGGIDADTDGNDDGDDQGEKNRSVSVHTRDAKGKVGMADAMARILGLATEKDEERGKSNNKSSAYSRSGVATSNNLVVLSKTVTPLQKLQKKQKAEEAAMKAKQRQKRAVNLTAMHVPLSVATSQLLNTQDGGSNIALELEMERMHRRVATRGVVALFNAIAQHQQQHAQQVSMNYVLNNNI